MPVTGPPDLGESAQDLVGPRWEWDSTYCSRLAPGWSQPSV
ncbi:hypothetical protein L841_1747 [Mycobacterium sp. MAC_080597_8934]|nr:hypothetical protein L841_1747 [Mycobacterium sp. MAC_080597_8934]